MTATAQSEQLYSEFKALNPNSEEAYNPTLPNLQRWHWHVTEAKFRPQYEKIAPGKIQSTDTKFANARRFRTFKEMPEYMRERFMQLAALYMGREVYAVGSRVCGEWIEEDSPVDVARMREGLSKAPKIESDYDIWMEPMHGDDRDELISRLPPWGDLLPHGVQNNQKLRIPMWNWDKLPKEEHAGAIVAFEAQRWGALMALHNKYQLSPQTLCCNDEPVRTWFAWAISNKIISK